MGSLLSGIATFGLLVVALGVLLRGMRPGGVAARTWSDLATYHDDGPPWSMALIAAFALGEVARHGTAVPAVAAVGLGAWCGLFRRQTRLVVLLPGAIGAVASVVGSIVFVGSGSEGSEMVTRAALVLCLGALFALFAITRAQPLAGLTWFAALDIMVFLTGPLGVSWQDLSGAGVQLFPVLAVVLAIGLAFMPSALLPLAAAGVVVVQLAGAGTGYLPGDVSVTVTMVMVTMIVFAVTAAFSRRLGASR